MTADRVVLVVEDQKDARELLSMLLELAGYQVLQATDGVEALEVLRNRRDFCVVLLDLMMPRMDGWEASRRIASDPDLPKPPILVVSGANDLDDEVGKLPVAGYLKKPIEPDALLEEVERFCPAPR